jgi:hypothetical protein
MALGQGTKQDLRMAPMIGEEAKNLCQTCDKHVNVMVHKLVQKRILKLKMRKKNARVPEPHHFLAVISL